MKYHVDKRKGMDFIDSTILDICKYLFTRFLVVLYSVEKNSDLGTNNFTRMDNVIDKMEKFADGFWKNQVHEIIFDIVLRLNLYHIDFLCNQIS